MSDQPTGQLVVPDYAARIVEHLRKENPRLLKKLSFHDIATIARPLLDDLEAADRDTEYIRVDAVVAKLKALFQMPSNPAGMSDPGPKVVLGEDVDALIRELEGTK